MNNCIITISREYGSGGRDVGRLLAEELGLPIFDKEIIHMATEKSGLPADFIEKRGESVPNRFWSNLKRLSVNVPNVRMPSGYNSHFVASNRNEYDEDKLFIAQTNIIREIASGGGAVIVGRCAGYILREHPHLLSVFIRGDFNDRVRRAIETYSTSEKDAAAVVKKIDKHRAHHYSLYTDRKWGAANNYDLVINTSYTGIPGAVSVIKAALEANQATKKE